MEYNLLWIAKRLSECAELDVIVLTPEIKVSHCDQEHLDELTERAYELLKSIPISKIVNILKLLPKTHKDFTTFVDYASYCLSEVLTYKLKLSNDECVSYFTVEYEKNISHKI